MYFGELNQHYRKNAWFWFAQGAVAIIAGTVILFDPAWLEVLLVALSLWYIWNGVFIFVSVIRGKILRSLAPMELGNAAFQLAIAGLILLGPVTLLADILRHIGGFLLIFRGLLSLGGFVQADTTIRYRRLMLLEAVIALFGGLAMIVYSVAGLLLSTTYIAIITIFEGVSHIRNAWLLGEQVEVHSEFVDTILSHVSDQPLDITRRTGEVYQISVIAPPPIPKPAPKTRKSFGRSWRTLDVTQYQRPMIIAPHPDDLEGFAAGLVYTLDRPVVSVVVAGGNLGVWEEEHAQLESHDYIALRLQESEIAARMLGVKEIIYMGYLDRGVVCDESSVERMLMQINLHQPDLIVSFEFYKRITPYAHPDHIATAQIVRNAIARYEPETDYIVASTLAPNYFLDVSDIRRIKLEALACHTTQAQLNSIIFPFFEKGITTLWGTFTGVRYAEGYRLIPKNDLLKNLKRNNPLIESGHGDPIEPKVRL